MKLGIKSDAGKRQWWLLSNIIEPMQQVIDVLAYGDEKYKAEDGANWRRVPNAKIRYMSAFHRHYIDGWCAGETHDKETGKHHLAHAITNLMFLLWFEIRGYPKESTND